MMEFNSTLDDKVAVSSVLYNTTKDMIGVSKSRNTAKKSKSHNPIALAAYFIGANSYKKLKKETCQKIVA